MKINIVPIVRDHLKSLRNEKTGKLSYFDYFIFFGVPIILGVFVYRSALHLDRESYNASITFFGVFIALLLNIQIAIFSIYQRKWKQKQEDIGAQIQDEDLEIRRRLLEQLNSNISYLVLICCLTLIIVLSSYIRNSDSSLTATITFGLYAHFILTMLMIVKRAHALFQREYTENQ